MIIGDMNKQLAEYFKREAEKIAARQEELYKKYFRGDPDCFDGFHSLIEKDIKNGLITESDL